MRIAVLAWGSLVASPGVLKISDEWQHGGPELPLEFSRISKGERLTLVIDPHDGRRIATMFATSEYDDLSTAIENLRFREETRTRYIGFVHQAGASSVVPPSITAWRTASEYDAVIWTALPSNFQDKKKVPFSVNSAVSHLRGLPPEVQRVALDYFRNAPAHVMTPLRERLISDGILA